jgi:tetraacyldisaccharide 4'-kinase
MRLDARLQRLWYGPAGRSLPLWPLELVFRELVALKSALYRVGLLRAQRMPVPVVVVGNITVGGTGKTPVAAWLAKQLTLRGHKVGVLLRGYGGDHEGEALVVTAEDDPVVVGDEALLHASRGTHVVVIDTDRVAAANLAVAMGADVLVCDDGLQHVRLARDVEIAVVDASRGLGNGHLLPSGPLREPASRLEQVDAVVLTDRGGDPAAGDRLNLRAPLRVEARLRLGDAVNLVTGERRRLESFAGAPVHAVAGIGHPDAFFSALGAAGLTVTRHALRDHARLDPAALPFAADATVLMTEKDAVKCGRYAQPGWWWVELDVSIERKAAEELLALVLERTGLTGAGVYLG